MIKHIYVTYAHTYINETRINKITITSYRSIKSK